MILAIIGSRSFDNLPLMKRMVSRFYPDCTEIVSGGARGADTLARQLARERSLVVREILPAWSLYGRAAGPKRNREIIDAADEVLAFWDGSSRGTAQGIVYARRVGKTVRVVRQRKQNGGAESK